jgi:hypothetical protein
MVRLSCAIAGPQVTILVMGELFNSDANENDTWLASTDKYAPPCREWRAPKRS